MEEPRFVLAAYPDQFRIEIIEFGGEMGRRPRRHAAPDRAAVDDDHRTAEAAELIGGGKAGNSRADYDYVATGVRRPPPCVKHGRRIPPICKASPVAAVTLGSSKPSNTTQRSP